ncbi:MAG TPA: response regulator [Herpetosiphonaceae bacterium]
MHVLIVDDQRDMSLVLSYFLLHLGHAPMVANDALQAVQRLVEAPPDVVLCDINLPHMSGPELAALLARDERTAALPFLFMSCSDMRSVEVNGCPHPILAKPLDLLALSAALAGVAAR